ncbi:MAG: LptA/OstA family protein, partial [Candidatus Brocadiaceae bacterium]
MHFEFRKILRLALGLTILVGAGLIVYVAFGDGPAEPSADHERAEHAGMPGSGEPAAVHEAPGPAEALAGEGPGAKRATPALPEAPPAGPSAADQQAAPAAPEAPKDMQTVVEDFVLPLPDTEKDREAAVVRGQRATQRKSIYDVLVGELVVNLWPAEGQPAEVRREEVRINFDRAELDEKTGVAHLFENVKALGEDWAMRTDSVTYEKEKGALASDDPVRIEKSKVQSDGSRSAALRVDGTGLDVDLGLRKLTLRSDVTARLFDVSDDFLAAELEQDRQGEGGREVAINCDGKMVYEHLANRVTFHQNVHVVSGEKDLRCEQFTVVLKETEQEGRLEVSELIAVEQVKMVFMAQVARGQKLEWQNVTQTGVLTGTPARLVTPDFDLSGEELSFFRLNDRFHCAGAGTLRWEGHREAAAEEADGFGPLRLDKNRPLRVSWNRSMTYHVEDRLATFKGEVTAHQQKSSLSCDQLSLHFGPQDEIQGVEAFSDVVIHDMASSPPRNVACDELKWDASADRLELSAAEGEMVQIVSGRQSIASRHIVLDNGRQSLECGAAGRLTVRPRSEEDPGAGEPPQEPPVEAFWQESMSFAQQPPKVAVFRGNARASRGTEQIKGNILRAEFDENMAPLSIRATENAVVDVRSPEGAGSGEEPAGNPIELPGIPAGTADHWRMTARELTISLPQRLVTSATPGSLNMLEGEEATGTVTWQSSSRLDLADHSARFEGDVDADVSEAFLKSQALRLDFDEDRNLRHLWAEGQVYFAQKGEGTWELESEQAEAIFSGENELRQVIARKDVKVRDAIRTLKAQMFQMFFRRMQVEGEEKLTLYRAVAQENVRVQYQG